MRCQAPEFHTATSECWTGVSDKVVEASIAWNICLWHPVLRDLLQERRKHGESNEGQVALNTHQRIVRSLTDV